MKMDGIAELLKNVSVKALKCSPLLALLLVGMLASVRPAQAQNYPGDDTWKSVAIIGGSTAAGAIIGHKIGGTTGAYVGAATGAAAGYAVDRWRRNNEYNNGYYGDNGGYYGNSGPYGGNGGYYGGGPYGYPAGYQSNFNNDRRSARDR